MARENILIQEHWHKGGILDIILIEAYTSDLNKFIGVVRIMKSWRLLWAGHVDRIGWTMNTFIHT